MRRGRLKAVVGGREGEERWVREVVEATRGRVMAERRGEAEKRWKARENSLKIGMKRSLLEDLEMDGILWE